MKAFLDKADELIQWFEKAIPAIRAYPRIFEDLDLKGLHLGQVLLKQRIIPEIKTGLALPLVALLCGGTNTGKSTMCNSLARRVVSVTGGGIASFTKRNIAIGPLEQIEACVKARPGWQLFPSTEIPNVSHKTTPDSMVLSLNNEPKNHGPAMEEQNPKSARDDTPLEGVPATDGTLLEGGSPPGSALYGDGVPDWPADLPIILDTPDIDSSDLDCRNQTSTTLSLADLVIWLTTQQKYKDKAGMTFLDEAMTLICRRGDVFNQFLPRHTEALQDLGQFYALRWPKIAGRLMIVPEQADLGEDDCIDPESLRELRNFLCEAKMASVTLKRENITHGLQEAGSIAVKAAKQFTLRQEDCSSLRNEIRHHFEKFLFSPLNTLEGHQMPFELQSALIRIIGPKVQTSFGGLVRKMNDSARQAAGWAFSFMGRDGSKAQNGAVDPTTERDHHDISEAVRILEVARFKLLANSRMRSQRGNPLHVRFHEDLKKLEFLRHEELRQKLAETLVSGMRERILPLISRFEQDLEKFCQENPSMLGALMTAIPGFAAVTGIAAAAFTIHTLTILPGITEYLLGGIALPIYSKLEKALPSKLLELADRISHEPFIQKARENFSKLRSSIFFEAADWLVKPVESLLVMHEFRPFDVEAAFKELHYEWSQIGPRLGNVKGT